MRRTILRTLTGLATVATATALMGLPAQAAQATQTEPHSGLTLFQDTFAVPLLHVDEPDGICRTFPATADSLAASGPVSQVMAFGSADCTWGAYQLGTLRTFQAGRFHSFLAL